MKRLLHVFVLLLSCVSIMKAEQLVATLQSGDATKAFYGYSALKDAYNEATDGDIITLSKGNFETVAIEKRITLRGAGAFVEGGSTSLVNLNVSADYAVIEGIYVTNAMTLKGNKQQILRCHIKEMNPNGSGSESAPATYDAYIADCAINVDGHAFDCVNATYKNCTILDQAINVFDESSATYDHCIVNVKAKVTYTGYAYYNYEMYRYGYFYNCILSVRLGLDYRDNLYIYAPNQFFNTRIYNVGETYFGDGVQKENCVITCINANEFSDKFKKDNFPYFFSEEVAATDINSAFVCGVVDHKEWPAIPRVIESNIDKETDASGHLKVEVKVSCER